MSDIKVTDADREAARELLDAYLSGKGRERGLSVGEADDLFLRIATLRATAREEGARDMKAALEKIRAVIKEWQPGAAHDTCNRIVAIINSVSPWPLTPPGGGS